METFFTEIRVSVPEARGGISMVVRHFAPLSSSTLGRKRIHERPDELPRPLTLVPVRRSISRTVLVLAPGLLVFPSRLGVTVPTSWSQALHQETECDKLADGAECLALMYQYSIG
ncbi:hypothetical protein VUR80DRAFT_2066 [Thermomyces stellatus]